MTDNESRIRLLEDAVKRAWRAIQNLLDRMTRAENRLMSLPGGGGSGGAGAGVFFCLPTTLGAATGTWPSLTPGSQSLTIYVAQGTTLSSLGTSTVYNWYPATPAASKVLLVLPDGAGNYVATAQSCV